MKEHAVALVSRTRRPVVAVVIDAVDPFSKGGRETRHAQMLPRLVEAGFDVHVFTMKWWDGPWDRTEGGVRFHALCRRYPLYKGARRSMLQAAVFALSCLRLLTYRLDVIDADQMPFLPLLALRVVAWWRRTPLLVTWHEVWGDEYWATYLGRLERLSPVAARLERLAMRSGDHLVTETASTRQRLVACGVPESSISVVPVGIDLDAIAAAPASDEIHDVLFVGRLQPHKGIDLLIGALGTLRDAGVPLRCGLVGDGPDRARIAALVAEHGLDALVRFMGSPEDAPTVFGLMKSARVVCLPSLREGFGIVVAEAIACGTPVVTTDHPDNMARLLVGPATGWLCAPTVGSLADALRRAVHDGGERRAGPEAVRSLAWDVVTSQLAPLYTRMLEPA